MKIIDIIRAIEAYHPAMPEDYDGVDGVKSGDPNVECTGIICSLVPTYEIVQKAVELGCNMIYTHEVSYYQDPDFPTWRGNFENKVYEEKHRLLEENGIVIYRDHDRTHSHRPDGIFHGVIKYLGWEKYDVSDKYPLPMSYHFEIPETTVAELNRHFIDTIGLNGVRYIGDPDAKITKVAIVFHIFAGTNKSIDAEGHYTDYSMKVIREIEQGDVQAILPGEIIEWDLLSYIRDGVRMGKPMACFNLGHFNWEELGARYAGDWLRELLGPAVPVQYVPTGDMWSFALKD